MAEYTKSNRDSAKQKRLEELGWGFQSALIHISNIETALQSDVQAGVKATQEFVSNTVNSMTPDTSLFANSLDAGLARDKSESIHRLNVCYLSIILGHGMGLSRIQLYELGLAAFLHDIGKTKIPLQILFKQPPYTLTERQCIERHAQYGVEILSESKNISKNVIDAIYQHHEKCDGTGYPHKRTAKNISIMAKIIAIVNSYDNLCNRYYLKRALTPQEGLSYLYTRLSDGLSMDIIKTFIKTIGVYPPGCLIELSDGNLGMVIATSNTHSTRPTIIIYEQMTPRATPIIINLSEVGDLNIVRSINAADAPETVVSYLKQGDKTGLFLGSRTTKVVPLQPAPPLTMEPYGNTAPFERRISFRVKPAKNSGLSVFFQGTDVNIIDISIRAVCISRDNVFFLKPQEMIMLIICVDGEKFDVESTVIRTWSSASDAGLQYFASFQFLSHAAMRESELSKKIMCLERENNPSAFERRMNVRVKPTLNSGLTVYIQGVEVNIVDVSVCGLCVSSSKAFPLKPQETGSVIMSIDDKKFDVKSRLVRTWSLQLAGGLRYFASFELLSDPAMRESVLGKKIMYMDRERFLNKIN